MANLELLEDFKSIKRSKDINDEAFLKILLNHQFAKEIDILKWGFSWPNGYLALHKTLQSTDINEYLSIFKQVKKVYDSRKSTLFIEGIGEFDLARYTESYKFKVFAGIAEIVISKTYMNNVIFKDMLLKEYQTQYKE